MKIALQQELTYKHIVRFGDTFKHLLNKIIYVYKIDIIVTCKYILSLREEVMQNFLSNLIIPCFNFRILLRFEFLSILAQSNLK